MMKSAAPVSAPPFSYLVKVGHISANPVTVHLEADAQERQALARLWKVEAVNRLKAELQITRWKKDGIRVRGRVTGELVQACVLTLEPIVAPISEAIEQIFVPEGSRLARMVMDDNAQVLTDPDGPDLPESFVGDSIDAGALVAEFAALGIDPYPRKPGVELPAATESEAEAPRKPSPFAVLKDWKQQ